MRRIQIFIAAFSAIASLQTVVRASPITVNNPSFESPDNGADVVTTAGWLNNPALATSGWSYVGGWGIQDWTDVSFANTTGDAVDMSALGADGNQAAYVNTGATIHQDVGALTANTTYTLTIAIGNRLDKNYGDTVYLGFYQDDLSTVLDTSASLGGTMANGDFDDFSFVYSTGGTVSGNLVIGITCDSGFGHTVVDNVRLDAIPEPATLGLVAAFGAGVLFVRRRLSM